MATESELRQHRACFTGHRPHKLHQPESVVIAALEEKIREAIDDGFVTFISGMAWGVDIWAAEIVLRLKAEGHPIHLVAAVPYEGFEKSWDDDWKQRYHEALAAADLVKYVCEHYHRGCFQVRNEWMVDHSALLIAPTPARRAVRRTPLIMLPARVCKLYLFYDKSSDSCYGRRSFNN